MELNTSHHLIDTAEGSEHAKHNAETPQKKNLSSISNLLAHLSVSQNTCGYISAYEVDFEEELDVLWAALKDRAYIDMW